LKLARPGKEVPDDASARAATTSNAISNTGSNKASRRPSGDHADEELAQSQTTWLPLPFRFINLNVDLSASGA
jgi:hypothetical protein